MKKENFSREEVKKLIETLLENPDVLIDAVTNEFTDWDVESLLSLVDFENYNEKKTFENFFK